jgi:hypothetical protein
VREAPGRRSSQRRWWSERLAVVGIAIMSLALPADAGLGATSITLLDEHGASSRSFHLVDIAPRDVHRTFVLLDVESPDGRSSVGVRFTDVDDVARSCASAVAGEACERGAVEGREGRLSEQLEVRWSPATWDGTRCKTVGDTPTIAYRLRDAPTDVSDLAVALDRSRVCVELIVAFLDLPENNAVQGQSVSFGLEVGPVRSGSGALVFVQPPRSISGGSRGR